ncbi:phage terminase small subunit P27 family [Lederbergia wuyishanensis]|uniref:P27 family predicted phage terminase small subunit n=1 Tax=Lederbergia wuyishanensis TaxID=1347903 RepID=A0ABU0D4I2_9BACI|nr:phage terminase small subunit P27 family [Lederbergia wuyishanensis]MCJ8008109.1 phage terminase small subunit P27 family [Lederbergia wuyishanensis]MDQ0343305.1 P27 family predicted phage terminase small subunit [Lederbergia wuyishanensis]
MVRPSKSVKTMSKNLTKEEIEVRKQTEEKLRGAADNISPPKHLNARQKKIFNYVVEELQASGILGNLDIYILGTFAISIDRLQQIEKQINKDIEKLLDNNLMRAKEKYTKDFFRCCNELSLSPQSRAKLGNINFQVKAKEDDPLLKVLSGGKK